MRTIGSDIAHHFPWRGAVVVAALVLVGVASTAAEAKMPPFEIDIAIEGTMVTVTVEVDEGGFDVPDLDGLVVG